MPPVSAGVPKLRRSAMAPAPDSGPAGSGSPSPPAASLDGSGVGSCQCEARADLSPDLQALQGYLEGLGLTQILFLRTQEAGVGSVPSPTSARDSGSLEQYDEVRCEFPVNEANWGVLQTQFRMLCKENIKWNLRPSIVDVLDVDACSSLWL